MSGLDLLAFGPHPDDLEIGLGGTIAKHVALGHAVGLCDLTRGEMSSNGTPDERMKEAEAARTILGAAWRENLALPDRAIGSSPDHTGRVVELIRRVRPRAIAIPYWQDRHPDHAGAATALEQAVFKSGLRRYVTNEAPWRPDWSCYYFINTSATPSFVIDVSAHYETKRAALACYRSQFAPSGPDAVATRLTVDSFRQLIESRDAQFGAQIGVAFAEGFVVREPVSRASLLRTES